MNGLQGRISSLLYQTEALENVFFQRKRRFRGAGWNPARLRICGGFVGRDGIPPDYGYAAVSWSGMESRQVTDMRRFRGAGWNPARLRICGGFVGRDGIPPGYGYAAVSWGGMESRQVTDMRNTITASNVSRRWLQSRRLWSPFSSLRLRSGQAFGVKSVYGFYPAAFSNSSICDSIRSTADWRVFLSKASLAPAAANRLGMEAVAPRARALR